MKIREATLEDSVGLAQVQVDSYRSAYADVWPQTFLAHFTYEEETQDWQTLLSSDEVVVLLVAENDQREIVGYALGKADASPEAQYDGSLTAIHVTPAWHNQGIGRQLLLAVVKHLQQQGCTSLWLSTLVGNPAQTWYERLGGVPIGEARYTIEDMEVVEMKYAWVDIAVLEQYAAQTLIHPMSDDQIRAALENDHLIDISTIGRKTGQLHRFEMWFHYLDRQIYLTGKPGRRDWYANIVAQPHITVHFKQSSQLDVQAFATPITDPPERQRVLTQLLQGTDYAEALAAWIEGSPLIHIALRSFDA